jgi:DNA-directed RNA polymerase subunit N (RpoN/RPB10)
VNHIGTLTQMCIPVRCFTCNSVIGDKFYKWMDEYSRLREIGEDHPIESESESGLMISMEKRIMDAIGLHSDCCRTIVFSYVQYKLKGLSHTPYK